MRFPVISIVVVLAGCASPIVHQRALAALSDQVRARCQAGIEAACTAPTPACDDAHNACVAAAPCMRLIAASVRQWQDAAHAVAARQPSAPLIAAATVAEATARTACAGVSQ
jgi:hypothetical protein